MNAEHLREGFHHFCHARPEGRAGGLCPAWERRQVSLPKLPTVQRKPMAPSCSGMWVSRGLVASTVFASSRLRAPEGSAGHSPRPSSRGGGAAADGPGPVHESRSRLWNSPQPGAWGFPILGQSGLRVPGTAYLCNLQQTGEPGKNSRGTREGVSASWISVTRSVTFCWQKPGFCE